MDRWTRAARKPLLALVLIGLTAAAPPERSRWQAQAARVTITRDDWGIAHVHGRTDADAVFGAIYAQAEDDFPRIERNYLTALGRQAEADGPRRDLGGSAPAALLRSGRSEGALCGQRAVAAGVDGRVGRRAELLSGDASRR